MPQNNMGQGYQGQYGNNSGQYGGAYGNGQYHNGYNILNPVQALQNQGFSFNDNFTANLLQSQIRQLGTQLDAGGQVAQPTTQSTTRPTKPALEAESTRQIQGQPSASMDSPATPAIQLGKVEEVMAEQPRIIVTIRGAEEEIRPSLNRSDREKRIESAEEEFTRPRVNQSNRDRRSERPEGLLQPRENRSDRERSVENAEEESTRPRVNRSSERRFERAEARLQRRMRWSDQERIAEGEENSISPSYMTHADSMRGSGVLEEERYRPRMSRSDRDRRPEPERAEERLNPPPSLSCRSSSVRRHEWLEEGRPRRRINWSGRGMRVERTEQDVPSPDTIPSRPVRRSEGETGLV
ncbi:uncharacterized protein N7483_012333 [Penicillium malachiteum]|uniref:uncharacterized protein n=1 Tax=Penicillium malachiteum TaxID=1324776 RepID=UPI00254696E4|nr:uncharacterized protein N7483_012333 [Penicillium malachiteum]KAJ5715152.1 hypothetical protein N7483_012333 [Penicillium malachiteum]